MLEWNWTRALWRDGMRLSLGARTPVFQPCLCYWPAMPQVTLPLRVTSTQDDQQKMQIIALALPASQGCEVSAAFKSFSDDKSLAPLWDCRCCYTVKRWGQRQWVSSSSLVFKERLPDCMPGSPWREVGGIGGVDKRSALRKVLLSSNSVSWKRTGF